MTGKGRARINRRGRGALARFRGCRPRKLSGRCPHPRVTAVAKKAQPPRRSPSPWIEAVDFLDLGARASKKVEHWRARLCGKQRKSTASERARDLEMDRDREKRGIGNGHGDRLKKVIDGRP